jgi:hypothetical protein
MWLPVPVRYYNSAQAPKKLRAKNNLKFVFFRGKTIKNENCVVILANSMLH